ncbi:MAG: hypothetical protein WD114_01710 [Phycisphaerales bacterium]
MEPNPPATPTPATATAAPIEGPADADAIAVSASELIEMIRSGQDGDVSKLVSRTLESRHAA